MTTETTRETRADEMREIPWAPPSTLDTPPAPEGYKYRWVRMAIHNEDDTVNVINRERQNYSVVRPEEVKGYKLPTSKHGKHGACIMVGDLILMKVPRTIAEQRRKYFAERAAAQQQAVNSNLMKNDSPLMPVQQRQKTDVTVGRAPTFEDED